MIGTIVVLFRNRSALSGFRQQQVDFQGVEMTSVPNAFERVANVGVSAVHLSVSEYGTSGPDLILLHGIGSRKVSWWPVIDQLAVQFHLIVPDLRGHGDSDKPERGYSTKDYAGDLQGLIEAMDLSKPLIMGHSLGGIVTLVWAVTHPDSAERIVLEDVPLRRSPDAGSMFADWIALASMTVEQAAAKYHEEHPDWSEEDCLRRAESITGTDLHVFEEAREQYTQGPGYDEIAPLAAIQSPTLLVTGDLATGGMVIPSDAERFAATVPNGTVAHIPGGAHSLHRDSTEVFLDIVVPFLLNSASARPVTAAEAAPR
jgi:N-formylmaleamate deformylase